MPKKKAPQEPLHSDEVRLAQRILGLLADIAEEHGGAQWEKFAEDLRKADPNDA